MNPKRIALAVGLAVLIAGVISYAFMVHMRSQHAATLKTIKLVAAAKPLAAGTPITADSVALINWPANMPVKGSFSKVEDVVGRSVIYPIDEHQPIVVNDVAKPGSGIGLTVKIPEGMRAVSVPSNAIVGVAGFLYPGSHVDVLLTTKADPTGTPITQTILSNVEVLTAGQRIEPDPSGKPQTVGVVTLLLKPQDGEKLVLAASQGSIRFVLRNGADQKTPESAAVNMRDVLGVKKAAPAHSADGRHRTVRRRVVRTKKPAAVVYEVETISGGKRKVDKFE